MQLHPHLNQLAEKAIHDIIYVFITYNIVFNLYTTIKIASKSTKLPAFQHLL